MGSHVPVHVPVMLEEVVEALAPRPGGRYVDCTFGRGGHTRAVLDLIGPAGRMLAIDRDPHAVAVARELARSDPRITVHHARFGEIGDIVGTAGLAGHVDAVLMDLGVSSPQIGRSRARIQLPERWSARHADGPGRRHIRGRMAGERFREGDRAGVARVRRRAGGATHRPRSRSRAQTGSSGGVHRATCGHRRERRAKGRSRCPRASCDAYVSGRPSARQRRTRRARAGARGDAAPARSRRTARGAQLSLPRRSNRQTLHAGRRCGLRAPAPTCRSSIRLALPAS